VLICSHTAKQNQDSYIVVILSTAMYANLTLEHNTAFTLLATGCCCFSLTTAKLLNYCCHTYVLVTNSPGKSNQHQSTKAARNFWNAGNGHQPPNLLYLRKSFNVRFVLLPEISPDEENVIYNYLATRSPNWLNLTAQSLSCAEDSANQMAESKIRGTCLPK